MDAFVLMALLMTGTPRPATWTAEFTSKERCEAAGKALLQFGEPRSQSNPWPGRVQYVCVPK
jgi:hypothetical protein